MKKLSTLRQARFCAGVSAIAAVGLFPSAVYAAEVNFEHFANAVQKAGAQSAVATNAQIRAEIAAPAAESVQSGLAELRIESVVGSLQPVLSVGLVNRERAVVRGEQAIFIGYSNYPSAIERSEIRIFPAGASLDSAPHFVGAVDANGATSWVPTGYAANDMAYVYRVYDRQGRFDETAPQPLEVLPAGALPQVEQVERAEFGLVDSAQVRGIATGPMQPVLAYGRLENTDDYLTIDGQIVPTNADGSFRTQVLQPASCSGLAVSVTSACGTTRSGNIPQSAWDAQPAKQVSTGPVATSPTPTDGFEIRTAAAGEDPGSDNGIEVRADGHSAEPVMSVGLIGSERTVVAGDTARFQTFTNYPSYVVRGEVRIFAAGQVSDAAPLATAATDSMGLAQWTVGTGTPTDLFYVYRVYDDKGRFDESEPQELTVLAKPVESDSQPPLRPNFGVIDEARVRNIPLNRTATVTVSGKADPDHDTVRVGGQIVPVNPDGVFITQQLVDSDSTAVQVSIERNGEKTFVTTREVSVPRSDWFVVGQGDLTFRSMSGSGPAVEVSGDPLLDGNSLTSRAAFYVKGRFGEGWKLTSSLDTGETLLKDIFSNLDRKDPRQLLRRLGSDEYYTTYGDDSTLVDDAPTQGQFYLRLQKDDSSLLVGNYVVNMNQAELAPLDRGLFGVAFDYKSLSTTGFGERRTQFTAFASDPGTVPGRDEFRATGGSLFFLKRQDITVGSERVRVEVRDKDTGIVLETRELRPQEDYDIDYFQGRLTLLRPLASTASTGNTVRDGSSTGNIPVVVVRYEFTPAVGNLDGYTLGGRGSAWLGDKLRLGVTAQRETGDTADQTLLGADAMLRLTAGTYLKSEIAQTNGPAFGQANSVDGGLTFTDIASPGVIGRKARAWKLEGGLDFAQIRGSSGDQGQLTAYYEEFDAGFAASSSLIQSDTTRWGAKFALPLGDSARIRAEYEQLRSDSAGTHRVAVLDLSQTFKGGVEVKLGLRHDEQVPGLLYNSTESGARTDAALELGYKPVAGNWSVYGFGQLTLDSDPARRGNNRFGVGAKAEVSERVSFSGEVSGGDGGLGADVQLTRRYGEGSEAYIGYSLLADRSTTGFEPVNLFTRSNSGTLTVGARHRFGSALSIYGENRIGHGGTAPSTMRTLGLKFDPSEKLSFSASFENGQIDDASTGLFRRTAGTVGFGYTTKEAQFGSQLELRVEHGGGRDQTVWLMRNNLSLQLNPDWRAIGRFNFAVADDNGTSLRAADYIEGTFGVAYRPVQNDRINLLARYSFFQDLGPVGQITSGGETGSPKQRSHIGAIDVNFDLSETVTIGAKYGYRHGSVSLDRTSNTFVSSNTHLGVLRLDWRAVRDWDLVVEGRYLSNDLSGSERWGGLAAIYRHVGNNMKIGVGYSVSDFSDDLTDQSYSSRGVFVNLLGKF